jgi:hypothetical protein
MKYLIKKFKINVFSLVIAFLFLGSIFSVQYNSGGILKESLYGLPLCALFIMWSQRAYGLIIANELKQGIKDIFMRDTFLINYSFYFSSILSIIIQYNNVDLMGWWLFYIYFMTFVGLIFSLAFSGLAVYIGDHKIYTLLFSLSIIVILSIEDLFHLRIPIGYLNDYVASWTDIIGLFLLHIVICFIRIIKNQAWFK